MKFHTLAIAAALTLMSSTAFARHCPVDMMKIDKALEGKVTLSETDLAEVKRLRAEGEKLHRDGKHQQSEEALAKAMKLLDIK